jgi:hypothetical protein
MDTLPRALWRKKQFFTCLFARTRLLVVSLSPRVWRLWSILCKIFTSRKPIWNIWLPLEGSDRLPLFSAEFLAYLGELKLAVDIDAVQEGEVVFAHEPLVRVQGPIIQCQLLETALLNFVNFQTLIATKAAQD